MRRCPRRVAVLCVAFCASLLAGIVYAQTAAAPRIVAVGGDVTEILYALGAERLIVATDTTSLYPPAALELPKVGYLRSLAAEGILSLEPTLVIAAGDAGPPEVLSQLEDAGVSVISVPEKHTIENISVKVERIAAAIGAQAPAQTLVADIERRAAAASRAVAQADGCPRVLFLLNIDDGAPVAAGSDTGADAIIRLAGGCNVFESHRGYKPLSVESAVEAAPDVILVMQQRLDELGGVGKVRANPALAMTPAARAGRIVPMDGLYLLGFGPRTPDAVLELAHLLHGDFPDEG